ncbi:MAG TPA: hypothetical protein VI643_07475 [Planctomycetota bacterium]|nr:hypothetical protein [Planctomycetota bacterium]
MRAMLLSIAGLAWLAAGACRPSEVRYRDLESGKSEVKRAECLSCEGTGFAPPEMTCGRCSGSGLDRRQISGWPEPPILPWYTSKPYGEPEKAPAPPPKPKEGGQ